MLYFTYPDTLYMNYIKESTTTQHKTAETKSAMACTCNNRRGYVPSVHQIQF